MIESQEMRQVFCATLMRLAGENPRIVELHADLARAHGMLPFQERFPRRFFNVGIAEANMAGIAAGMAECGLIPLIHSLAVFATRRCFDQLAVSVGLAGLGVKIVGTDPGAAAELNGATHMAVEDIAIMRALPGMTVFEATDSVQLREALPVLIDLPGPVYIRMIRRKAVRVFPDGYVFSPDKAEVLAPGNDATILASGVCVAEALDAAQTLSGEGLQVRVVNVHTIKPLDVQTIVAAARETGAVVTAENHSILGGLGGAVSEVLVEHCPVPMERVGIKDRFGEVGRMDSLMETFGINARHIAAAVRRVLGRKQTAGGRLPTGKLVLT